MRRKIQFWYEFASTYSYLSAMRIEKIALKNGFDIEWRPFLLGPIFASQNMNDSPFNIYPIKGRYMWKDMARQCQKYALEFHKPLIFPQNGLLAARVAKLGQNEEWCADFSKAVYQANFVHKQDISLADTLANILVTLELNDEVILKQANSDENKLALKQQTETAVENEIFGAPSFIVDSTLYWGNDRLEDALLKA